MGSPKSKDDSDNLQLACGRGARFRSAEDTSRQACHEEWHLWNGEHCCFRMTGIWGRLEGTNVMWAFVPPPDCRARGKGPRAVTRREISEGGTGWTR